MIGIRDLAQKGLLGKRMASELLDRGLVSVMDLRGRRIKELYGTRRTFDRESRRLRQTLKEMGMIWTRYIDFDKGVETYAMYAFDQMCADFSDVAQSLRSELVHAQMADFYIRFFPEALFQLFAELPDEPQMRCRSAVLLLANRIYRHARQCGRDKEYEAGMLYLQSQVMNFSRAGHFLKGNELWRSFIQSVYDWLSYFYFSVREQELINEMGIRLPDLLDIETMQIAERSLPVNLRQRIVAFVYQIRRLNDLYCSYDERQLRSAISHMPVICLPEEQQNEVAQMKTKLGFYPALHVIRLFLANSPSPACRYWYFRLCRQLDLGKVNRPFMTALEWERIMEDRERGRALWQQWLPIRYKTLRGDQGVKIDLSPEDSKLLQQERLPARMRGLFMLLSLVYPVDYIRIDQHEAIIRRDKLPRFKVQHILHWAADVRDRMPQGMSTSVREALKGAAKYYHYRLIPLVEAACQKFKIPLPDKAGNVIIQTSSRVIRDRVAQLLREKGEPMALKDVMAELECRFPELIIDTDEKLLRDKLLRDGRFLALKRTGFYGLIEWQTEGRMSIYQRVRELLLQRPRPMSLEELLSPLLTTHPALTTQNLRKALRAQEGKGLRAYGLDFYGLTEVSYWGYTPLSVPLRSDPEFDLRFQELEAYIKQHRALPMVDQEESIRLALWWNRFVVGMTRLTLSQRKRVFALEGWIRREGFPRDLEEKRYLERCEAVARLAQDGQLPQGELLEWFRFQCDHSSRLNGVRKRYFADLRKVLKDLFPDSMGAVWGGTVGDPAD